MKDLLPSRPLTVNLLILLLALLAAGVRGFFAGARWAFDPDAHEP